MVSLNEILEEFEELFDDLGIEDKLVTENHEFVEEFNKKKHFKVKMPIEYGNKAS